VEGGERARRCRTARGGAGLAPDRVGAGLAAGAAWPGLALCGAVAVFYGLPRASGARAAASGG